MPADTVDLDPETHAQVASLLGAERAAQLLGLLQKTLRRMDAMPADALVEPAGLAWIHRLKSEAGLMGFARLSLACGTVEAAGTRGGVRADDVGTLREAIAVALDIIARSNAPLGGIERGPRP